MDDLAIVEIEGPVGSGCYVGTVRYHHQRYLAIFTQLVKEIEYLASTLAVEVACRLIGQQQFRVVGEGASDGDPLAFTHR